MNFLKTAVLVVLATIGVFAQSTNPLVRTELPPKPKLRNNRVDLVGHWKDIKISSGLYAESVPSGMTKVAGNDAVYAFKTYGQVYFVDFEPRGDRSLLDVRLLYKVHVAGNEKPGCGKAMKDASRPPEKCIVHEEVVTLRELWEILYVSEEAGNNLEALLRAREHR